LRSAERFSGVQPAAILRDTKRALGEATVMNRLARNTLFVSVALGLVAAWMAFAGAGRTYRSHAGHDHAPMTDADMKQWTETWWSTHEPVGVSSQGPPAATFVVRNFQFDGDANPGTPFDTVRIELGESVLWQRESGFHTVTNGIDSLDPEAGALFDIPIDNTNPSFQFAFNTQGTYPFFCRPHEGGMFGVVVVQSNTGVDPRTGRALGFTRSPSPNPSARGVSFGFALSEAGSARVEVFDAAGRRVAVPLDRELAAGAHEGAWDGRRVDGARAGAGIYYLRLGLPGHVSTRKISLTR
jgi:plastocyanin